MWFKTSYSFSAICSIKADVQEVIEVEEVGGSVARRNGIWHFARHGEAIKATRDGLMTRACELEYSSRLGMAFCAQMHPNAAEWAQIMKSFLCQSIGLIQT